MDKIQNFYVLQGADGVFYPMAFISPVDEAGIYRANEFKKKLEEGEKIVRVRFELISES